MTHHANTLLSTAAPFAFTADQERAVAEMSAFFLDPDRSIFVVEGYSGTGKSTLLRHFISQVPKLFKTLKLLNARSRFLESAEVYLTATTNQAAEALGEITGYPVSTIHNLLGLRLETDFGTGTTTLYRPPDAVVIENAIIFIDEASWIDRELLEMIFQGLCGCKVIFVGDPAQLVPVRSRTAPVFAAGFDTVRLAEVVRQGAGNPIIELATLFRHTVESGVFPQFTPDGHYIRHLDRAAFLHAIVQDAGAPGWAGGDSKTLAWRNRTVIAYNRDINEALSGSADFAVGDHAVVNNFISIRRCRLRTNQAVRITGMVAGDAYGLRGYHYELNGTERAFMPNSLDEKKALLKRMTATNDAEGLRTVRSTWIDLRAAYSCTVNKSQGSTYARAYIDLTDLSACRNANTLARMLYVATSRASEQVIFTGDII